MCLVWLQAQMQRLRIDALTNLYTKKSNEDNFRPDKIFESFHHQAKTAISNMVMLARFLML